MDRKNFERLNLHDQLQKKSYDHAVICTFSFDPIFFEDYCLLKFNSLNNNGNITVNVDLGTYEKVHLPRFSRHTEELGYNK